MRPHRTELIIATVGVGVSIVGIVLYKRSQDAANAKADQTAQAQAQQNAALNSLLAGGGYGGGGGSSADYSSSHPAPVAGFDSSAGGLLHSDPGTAVGTPTGAAGGSLVDVSHLTPAAIVNDLQQGQTVYNLPPGLSASELATNLAITETLSAGNTYTEANPNGPGFITLHPNGDVTQSGLTPVPAQTHADPVTAPSLPIPTPSVPGGSAGALDTPFVNFTAASPLPVPVPSVPGGNAGSSDTTFVNSAAPPVSAPVPVPRVPITTSSLSSRITTGLIGGLHANR